MKCDFCKAKFKGRPNQKYCSSNCRKKAWNKRAGWVWGPIKDIKKSVENKQNSLPDSLPVPGQLGEIEYQNARLITSITEIREELSQIKAARPINFNQAAITGIATTVVTALSETLVNGQNKPVTRGEFGSEVKLITQNQVAINRKQNLIDQKLDAVYRILLKLAWDSGIETKLHTNGLSYPKTSRVFPENRL